MKKNYPRFALQLFLLICGTAILVFALVGLLVIEDFGWNQDAISMLQSIGSICLVVWIMSLVLALPSFIVRLDGSAVRKGFRSKSLSWSDIDHVKIVGLPRIKHFNKIIFSGHGHVIEIGLFIFDDQEKVVEYIRGFLPWATSLDMANLPSEASIA